MNLPSTSVLTDAETIRVFLVDDQTLFRQGLRRTLEAERDLVVVGEASNGSDALQQVADLHPNVVIVDISMPQMNGIETTRRLKQLLPTSYVILLTMYEDPFLAEEGRKVGASGFLVKMAADHQLYQAIREVHAGRDHFVPQIREKRPTDLPSSLPPLGSLSAREREILRHLANGIGNREIAERLGIRINTVETHRKNLMKKLRLHSLSDIIRYAMIYGLISA